MFRLPAWYSFLPHFLYRRLAIRYGNRFKSPNIPGCEMVEPERGTFICIPNCSQCGRGHYETPIDVFGDGRKFLKCSHCNSAKRPERLENEYWTQKGSTYSI